MILPADFKAPPPKYPQLKKLRRLRMAQGYTQSEFAKVLGCDWITYIKIENGRIMPNALLLDQIAEELDISPDDLRSD
ncbi:MAG: helix-turn-helix transcriptional regulator [Selenomonadaceae bacterium]|nr:helix-turn-helix transcriptional regulator [Selenomonadaceae bacterium]MBR0103804.1 helix-turn-helix transcriptional regulator [Selenomonadaceae bacterium]